MTKNAQSCLFAEIITLLSVVVFISPALAIFQKIFAAVKIEESRKAWEQLSRKLAALTEQNVVETRVEERLRLEQLIEQTEQKRQELEKKLLHLEQQRGNEGFQPTCKQRNSSEGIPSDWPATPWWALMFANSKLRYLLLLLILGAGAIMLYPQSRQTSSPPEQVHPGRNDNISLASEKAADKSEATMQAPPPAVESSRERATDSGKGTNLTITTSGQGQITIGGDVINTGGNVEKSYAK